MSLSELDIAIFFFVNQDMHNGIFDYLMPLITQRYYILVILIVISLVFKDKKMSFIAICLSIVSFGLADGTGNILKHLFERPRPCHLLEGVRLLVPCGEPYSMPSNHAANSFAIVFPFFVFFKLWLRYLLIAIAFIVAFSRVYVGVHYPSDVVIGTVIGIAVSGLIIVLYKIKKGDIRIKS